MTRLVVIGGGITGLACARGLADRLSDADVTLLEASSRLGGPIQSATDNGFTWEAGPNGFLNRHPSTLALAVRLGLDGELITACEENRRRLIRARGRLRRFPDSPATFLTSDLLSLRARLRMLLEPLVPPARDGSMESVGDFARRRLGREAAERLVEPVVCGIYAGHPDRLCVRSALPQLAALDGGQRSLLRAYLHARRELREDGPGLSPTAIGRRRLVSFRRGYGQLVEALGESLGPRVRMNSPVQAVVQDGRGFRIEVGGDEQRSLEADIVVSAAPAHAAARYFRRLDADLAGACHGLRHVPVTMVALGYREAEVPHPLNGFGYLVAGSEGGSVLGVYWSTSVFPGHRSPPGHVLIQVILGGSRDPEIGARGPDDAIELARDELRRSLGVVAAPVLARLAHHPRGLPQYELGHQERLTAMQAAMGRHPGLFVTGNAWRGVGTNACTADAERVVEAVARHLGLDEVGVGAVPGQPARV